MVAVKRTSHRLDLAVRTSRDGGSPSFLADFLGARPDQRAQEETTPLARVEVRLHLAHLASEEVSSHERGQLIDGAVSRHDEHLTQAA
jgi:hypothetical protein